MAEGFSVSNEYGHDLKYISLNGGLFDKPW